MKGRAAALISFMSKIQVLGWPLCDSSPALASSPPFSFYAYVASISHVHHSARQGLDKMTSQRSYSVVLPMMHCGGGYSTRDLSGKELRPSGHSGLEVWLRAHCYCSVRSCTPTVQQLAPINSQRSGRSDCTSSRQKPERRRFPSRSSLICYSSHFFRR
jgi:hypothetical protein